MKGTTNSKLLTALKEIVQLNLITNQNSSSDLVGATITVEYGGEVKNYTWDGNQINIEIPEGWEYTISVGDVSNYKTPSPVTFTSEGNSVTNVDMQYLTELVTITVTTEDGTSANGSIINCNGTNHTYNGVFTKKFAYGTTYTITPNNFGNYNADPVTYTAGQISREISIIYSLGFPKGTTFEFSYTGSVQNVELKKGTYKLQCWGAQGGNVTGTYAVQGAKGGYSEGVLKLTEPTTLYVFVGGQGGSYTSTGFTKYDDTTVSGGVNGGGDGERASSYGNLSSLDSNGCAKAILCFPRGGGGATDISTITDNIKKRTSTSLLARCIVAGGGGGASSVSVSTISPVYVTKSQITLSSWTASDDIFEPYKATYVYNGPFTVGARFRVNGKIGSYSVFPKYEYIANGTTYTTSSQFIIPSGIQQVTIIITSDDNPGSVTLNVQESITSIQDDYYYLSDGKQYGGGTSGGGYDDCQGTQSSAGSPETYNEYRAGGFGYGGSYPHNRGTEGGGGGSGWYGGTPHGFNNQEEYVNYTGGGSGFVNIASNAKYRPEGYTGLQLDSGQTIAGNKSFESPTGGTETGHLGNGYARITVL